jgi:hypothetical protein
MKNQFEEEKYNEKKPGDQIKAAYDLMYAL